MDGRMCGTGGSVYGDGYWTGTGWFLIGDDALGTGEIRMKMMKGSCFDQSATVDQ